MNRHRRSRRPDGGRASLSRPRRPPGVVTRRRPVLEAIRAGLAVQVLVSSAARSTVGLRELVEAAGARGVPVDRVPSERLDELAEDTEHQGVVARVRLPRELGEPELASRDWGPEAIVVVLDGVTDPRNVGALARTAEAAGAEALVVRRRRGAGASGAAFRASAGALLHLPLVSVPNLARALGTLKGQRFWVVGLDEKGPRTVFETPAPEGRICMVVGSEGRGLSPLVRRSCDELLRIPMAGRVSSLNVSVAAGVGLFAYALRGKEHEGGGGKAGEW